MNKKRIGIFIALLAMVCMGLRAQSATSLRINEVLVVNDQNYQDDYGLHNAWIEIFNTSFASVNLEGCFLTNDKNNPTKYPIPKGDVLTLIKPRQHALFWADGMPNRGTFHVNFTLDPNKENYIALYDSNGKTLIDEVTIPAGQLADRSYAREKDGSANWVVKGEGEHSYVTPSTNNMTIDKNPKIENFKKHDSIGIGMAIIAMSVVPFLGYIPLGFMNATIIHVPVIIGAIILGPKYGAYLGLVFGVTSLVKATIAPGVTSFVFSPFVTIGGYSGNMWSAVIAIVPRVCIGIVAYFVYKLIMKAAHGIKGSQTVALWVAGIAGAMTNTLLVMNGIYIFFGQSYAAASNKAVEHIYDVILGIILGFGIPEAIVAGILTTAITKVLFKIMKDNG